VTGPHPPWEAAARGYRAAGLFLLNCVVVFVALNALAWMWLAARGGERRLGKVQVAPAVASREPGQPVDNGRRTRYVLERSDLRAYDGVPAADVETVLDEFGTLESLGFVSEPWVQFGEPEMRGRLVHVDVDPQGFHYRRTVSENAPGEGNPIDVFVFGGSTTFGYNVADAWTFPSYLEEELQQALGHDASAAKVRVTNWGRRYYYSSQEVVLFSTLLRKGYRPKAAFFLDGLNDVGTLHRGGDAPYFTPKTRELWHRAQFGSPPHPLADHFEWLPILQLAKRLRQGTGEPAPSTPPRLEREGVRRLVNAVLDNYQGNQRVARSLCREFQVQCFFLWQPVPYYAYDRELHRHFPPYGDVETVFERCWKRVQEIPEPPIFLGDLLVQYDPGRHPFVDDLHYSPGFSRFMARRVATITGPALAGSGNHATP
jgi:hypothetical protein